VVLGGVLDNDICAECHGRIEREGHDLDRRIEAEETAHLNALGPVDA
jgi:hypothetical protein